MTKYRSLLTFWLVFLSGTWLTAEVSLPAIFSDHMVLQQNQANPIWGWATPGETVLIEFADQQHSVTANERGEWRAELTKVAAGGPHTLTVRGANLLEINEVLVGEVWLASGQSNMQFSVSSTANAAETLASADCSRIRLFQVAKHSALEPASDTPSKWAVCDASTLAGFSAVAYFFGKRLQESVKVPIGLINASWGGTNAEEWTRRTELHSDPEFEPILDRWQRNEQDYELLFTKDLELELWLDDLAFLPASPEGEPLILDDFEDGDLKTSLFGNWQAGAPSPWGFNRVETELDQSRALHFRSASRPGSIPSLEVHYTPGRYIDLSRYRALQFRCRGSGLIRVHSIQPSINDWDNYAVGPVALSSEWQTVTVPFNDLSQAGWGKAQPFSPARLSGALFELMPSRTLPRPPSGLYNGMIHPLVPFGLRGAIWYQGEGNAGRAYQYHKLLPAMIKSWRSAWKNPSLPFLIVQLPNFGKRQPQPSESAWAELREAQLLTARNDPYANLAVTIDLGEDDDVHPREKREVGQRLAVLAEDMVYSPDVSYVSSGPRFQSFRIEDTNIRVEFTRLGGGLESAGGSQVRGFSIAGPDRKFHWAEARIEGDSIVVSSPAVQAPVAVRYAWADNPEAGLYNAEGFPASPFRTDDWPGVTAK